jgi:septal ring factor EnvC (AmiA/AmiB activator)
VRIITDYKHAQQIIVELDAEIERLTARLIAESGEVEDLVNRLQESEDDNGRLMKRIAEQRKEIEKLLASKFAASSPKLIAKIITLASEVENNE